MFYIKVYKWQHRCVAIFKDKHQQNGEGFALGGIEGKVAIIYLNSKNPLEVINVHSLKKKIVFKKCFFF